MKKNMVRAISENGGIVVCAIDSTEIVSEMERVHQTSAVVSAALGRLLTGAALMGSWLKNEQDSLTLRVNGEGPAGTLLAVAEGDGSVRGYATRPVVEGIPLRADGKLDVGAAVGTNGFLAVTRDLGLNEPYMGQVPLVSGEIAEDITSYYATSEQTPTVCALGVLVNEDLTIRKAGGFLLQLLPGATEEEITALEKNIAAIPPITKLLEDGGTVYDMVELALAGFNPNILDESRVDYTCHCSRERVENILVGLGRAEVEEMLQEKPTAVVECHFCDKRYEMDLQDILSKMK
ncbi:Hsp33 family molecular chaperone HslO [Ruminococcaceae bacterium OttesenSCG-928-A16]|nr:Hsp33 family molecular chaperone HslO [Ruminococcaceae bacterium OttesenSCG-928-A16]